MFIIETRILMMACSVHEFEEWAFKTFFVSLVIVFINYILFYSKSEEDHANHLRIVLRVLGKQKLYAKFSMCKFLLNQLHFWGHVVSK